MDTNITKVSEPELKQYKKIPVHVVEEHNEALQFIYSAIGGKKLPLEGNTLLHLDAHPDLLIDRKLKGDDARSGRKLLPLLQIENWILPAAAAGHIDRVVWIRPPWAKQFSDGTRDFHIGDQPDTGLLRVDCKEPYYLSDALYSKQLLNKRKVTLTVAELNPELNEDEHVEKLTKNLNIRHPYVLDIDLDFFSTGNPFLSLHESIDLYDRLLPIFDFKLPDNDSDDIIEEVVTSREHQLQELERLFQHLEEHNSLMEYQGDKSALFEMVYDLSELVLAETERNYNKEPPDWWAVFAGGCTRDQGGLPYHISTEEQIRNMINKSFRSLLHCLPPPVLITVARSTDDGYCPPSQVELIQSLVLETISSVFINCDEPALHYLNVNIGA